MTLTRKDMELIDVATTLIEERYVYKKHHVASAVRTTSGEIFTGLHLKANVGRATVCAEPAAMSAAFVQSNAMIATIVAVKYPNPDDPRTAPYIVSPCGVCRELIAHYSTETMVIHPTPTGLQKSNIMALLPYQFLS